MKSPSQEVYDIMFGRSQAEFETYDHTPLEDEKVTYPYVVIGQVQHVKSANKYALAGKIYLTVDVWGNSKQRLLVSTIAERISQLGSFGIEGKLHQYFSNPNEQDITQTQDTSVPKTIFNRATVSLVFNLK